MLNLAYSVPENLKEESMKGKNILIVSLVFNALMVALLIFFKGEAQSQAKEHVAKVSEEVNASVYSATEARLNNNVLWQLAIDLLDAGDLNAVQAKKMISETTFPPVKSDGESKPLVLEESQDAGKTVLKFGWEKAMVQLRFNNKGGLDSLDYSELLKSAGWVKQNQETNEFSLEL